MKTVRARTEDDSLRAVLSRHPLVELVDAPAASPLEFDQGTWHRQVHVGDTTGLRGLVELMDNNPLVCADSLSVPDAGSTLALIAIGPLIRAGILVEAPVLMYSFEVVEATIDSYLESMEWPHGASVHLDFQDLGSVVALNAMAIIQTPARLEDIDDLYAEAYGRSFFVRREESETWDTALVADRPHAVFRLRISPDEPNSLLTIQVMADRDGKAGAAQIVHAMNVMAGFEESLGIAE